MLLNENAPAPANAQQKPGGRCYIGGHGQTRRQRHTCSERDHLDQRVQQCGGKAVLCLAGFLTEQAAHRHRVFAQTLPVLQEQQPL